MKAQKQISLAGLFLIGGLLGWFLGSGESRSDESTSTQVTKSSRTLKSSPSSGSGSLVDARMLAIRNSNNKHERLGLAMKLANTLPISEAARWLDEGLFSQREGFAIVLFTRILEKRWRREDPDGHLLWQLRNGGEISKENMTAFAGENPDRFLAQIEKMQDPDRQGQAIINLSKAQPDLVLAKLLANEWGVLVRSGAFYAVLRELAKADLPRLQSVLDDLPLSMQSVARQLVGHQLLWNDFPGTLDQLLERRDGIDILVSYPNLRGHQRDMVLECYSDLPKNFQDRLRNRGFLTREMKPDEVLATDWTSYGLSEKESGNFRGEALFNKARHNREEALAFFQNADLNETGRRYYLERLSLNQSREIIEDLLPHLNEADRKFISEKITKEGSSDLSNIVFQTANDLSNALAQSEPEDYWRARNAMRTWSDEQKAQFETDYATMQGEARHRVTAVLVQSDDLQTRAAAINEMMQTPEAREIAGWQKGRGSELASEVVVDLLQGDVDQAASWVKNLPEGSDRTWAMKNFAANWIEYEPVKAREFVDSLPPPEREAVSKFIRKE